MTLNRPVPVVLGLSALYGASYAVIRWLCEGTPFRFWGWWAFFTGLILFLPIFLFSALPKLHPRCLRSVEVDEEQHFETRSWLATLMPLFMLCGLALPAALGSNLTPEMFDGHQRHGSVYMLVMVGVLPLLCCVYFLVQVFGDGASGVRIYPDRVEVRKVGYKGWRFEREDIESMEVLGERCPSIYIWGKGEVTDRLGWLNPDVKSKRSDEWLCSGTSGQRLYDKLCEFGYGDLTTYSPSGKPTNQKNNS